MEAEEMAEIRNEYFVFVFTKEEDAASVSLKEDIVEILMGEKLIKKRYLKG